MHCVRRAALRAACSSSRFAAAPRQQIVAIVMPAGKTNVQPANVLSLPRYFSQTRAVANEENSAVENAIREAEDSGSTGEPNSTLQSSLTENQRITQEGYTIFISNVTFDATEAHLQEAFGKYGDILRSNIGRDGRGLSRGFGFVTFTTKVAADRAVAEANNSFWHGRRIVVDHRKQGLTSNNRTGRDRTEPSKSLYIGNIPYEASDADLNQLFRSLDNVSDVRVAIDRNTGWPRGFAHADFHDVDSAIKAHDFLLTQTLGGRALRVDYAETRNTTSTDAKGSLDSD
ncbi:RNA-binding domain-containing protein [Xylaria bambusicola]|uniref:RNA-binding domain-containing protein n=1 Tax=Xylaria bambusicola TaxID=326684 RepID=UPI002007DE9C|nr:RNA-binding domain-containing protein [Xylaria bambusicola]KAI0506124.1 RNA-binding domain-containing protein [Xylaria bambusicola]